MVATKLIENIKNTRASEMSIAPRSCSRDKSKGMEPRVYFHQPAELALLTLATMLSSVFANLSHAARAPDNAQRAGL